MKKILVGLICSIFMCINVNAEVVVKFTENSKFETGNSVTIDIEQMKDMDSAVYNAWLEGTVEYSWYLNGTIIKGQNKKSLKISEEYLGKEIHVKVKCLDYEYEAGPFEVTGEMTNPPIGVETPDVESSSPQDDIIDNVISTQTEDKNENNKNMWKARVIEYVIIALLIVAAFITGYLIGKTKNKKEE